MVLIISLNKLWILPPALGPLSLDALVGAEDVEVVGDLVGTAVQVQGAGDEAESWNSLEVSCRLLRVHLGCAAASLGCGCTSGRLGSSPSMPWNWTRCLEKLALVLMSQTAVGGVLESSG